MKKYEKKLNISIYPQNIIMYVYKLLIKIIGGYVL